VLGLVQQQALRLQAMSDELETARASLNERKLVERAKGLLMAHRRLSEDDAYKTLRRMAMNQNRRLVDVAQAVLAMADMLTERAT
jgi:AmiR/NasT family two-component response regulator